MRNDKENKCKTKEDKSLEQQSKDKTDSINKDVNLNEARDLIYKNNSSPRIIEGNLNINVPKANTSDKITLKNIKVNGDINADFGEGTVILENVQAAKINVKNVGSNSLYIKGDSSIGVLVIEDTNNNAHIVIDGNSKIESTTILSGANIEVGKNSKEQNPFGNINIAPKDNQKIILAGKFNNIKISEPSQVVLQADCIISSNLDINSSVKLTNHCSNIERVNINTSNDKDIVEIEGKLENVNAFKGNINIKKGEVKLACKSDKVSINVNKDASIIADAETLKNVKSEGKKTERNKSSEAKITKILFKDSELYDPHSDVDDKEIRQIPAGITVKELLNNIQCSAFSKITVLDEKDRKVNDDNYVTLSMKVLVESEDGKNKAKYTLENFWRHETNYKYFNMYDKEEVMKDENNDKGFFTGNLEFKGLSEEKDIQGYYVTIEGQKVNDYENKGKTVKNISQKFVKKSKVKDSKYKVEFENIDLKGYDILNVGIYICKDNRISWTYGYESIYDNPITVKDISSDGIEILDFEDTNKEKGKINGKVKFTRAKDETNIKFYQLDIDKKYSKTCNLSEEISIIGLSKCKEGIYEFNINKNLLVGDAETIKLVVTPIGMDGVKGKPVEKIINDEPINEKLISNVPKLKLNDKDDHSLVAENCTEGNQIKLYKRDYKTQKFIPYVKDGKEFVEEVHSELAYLYGVEPGRYKVVQVLKDDSETDMSNDVVVKPEILKPTVQQTEGLTISITNATNGATINVYDKNNKIIKKVNKEEDKTLVIKLDKKDTYYISQVVNEIESDKVKIS